MASYATYIADPDLETLVIKAIASINGDLSARVVSPEQLRDLEREVECTLLCTKPIKFKGPQILIDHGMDLAQVIEVIAPTSDNKKFSFNKVDKKVVTFAGLSGGVGTTSIALNYAFEKSTNSRIALLDLNSGNPEIATALGLHRIDERNERISKNLTVRQGIAEVEECDEYVCDLGCDTAHQLISMSDEFFLVARLGFNTLARLREQSVMPSALIVNFFERSKFQHKIRESLIEEFPRLRMVEIPFDSRSFEMAAYRKSALLEVSKNSHARKSIATLA